MNLLPEISFLDLSFCFDSKKIISNFSEIVNRGEHVCLMGESGSGKSTLLNSVVGLSVPTSGKILLGDLEVNAANLRQIRTRVAWLPQHLALPYASVEEMLKAPYEWIVNRHLHFDRERCLHLFRQLGLESSLLEKNLSKISGGERQRVALVSALMLDRKVLLLDEPSSALDLSSRDKLIDLLRNLRDTTVLSITHDEAWARSMDRTIVLRKKL